MAIPDSPNPSGCDTIELYISCSRGTPLSGGDYPQKNMAKRFTRTMGETVACRRLIACLPCLSLASIEDRERARSGGLGFGNYINQIERKYIPTSPQAFYKFILSILWQEKKRRRNEPRPRDLRARCALCKPRSEIIPREGNFIACYYLQQGKTRTNNQIADSEQEFDMYEPRSRRE